MHLVEIKLDTGQVWQSDVDTYAGAYAVAAEFIRKTMVERATIIDMKTGEVLYDEPSFIMVARGVTA